ncbi:DHH family phosphoesterase [Aureibacillus halotolerans]|uniref:Phosphoesterase RecJ-like protein n=1 Tax=Aureibacillus halotolerans TaxID=1508390 RepID=A0A4R6TYU3_9BACI|nr:bifunctional oligoribonuclease/PAP phosphatase NrnA [Aureibacillus halotolerans]TDQ39130.1 phosphoesterase RecJ-like protein [Aureibacillus halotolerans]
MSELLNAIKAAQKIVIHRHVRPDPDAYGSQCSLAEIIKENFPEKTVLRAGEGEPTLQFLSKMDEVEDVDFKDALVIVCDTANQARVDDQRYATGATVFKVDHHPNDDPYGDYNWVETTASSTSEMIYEWYSTHKEELRLPAKAAELIYAGIVGDTGRFLFPSASPKTYRYASELVTYPFSRTVIHDALYETKANVLRLQGHILQTFSLSEEGVASVSITRQMLKQFETTAQEASQLVGMLGNVSGIKAWVFFIEEEHLIRVRLRSKGPVVNTIAKRYEGGGHPLAAGASIYDWEMVHQVVSELKRATLEA